MTDQQTERDFHPKDVAELLRRWDAGESVWSIELGGLGPGYEQAIQVAAVEMARDGQSFKPTGDKTADSKAWDAICTESLRKHDEQLGGITGAMYGAASWLAYQWCHNGGPADLMRLAEEKAKADGKDRRIQISRNFPRAGA